MKKDNLERVPGPALGSAGSGGLLHGGSVEPQWAVAFYVLFFIELSTRKVEIAGITSAANGLWMTQVARNVTDPIDGFLKGKRHLIHDRDPLYTAEFLTMLEGVGGKSCDWPRGVRI
jgi:hypothetical protein